MFLFRVRKKGTIRKYIYVAHLWKNEFNKIKPEIKDSKISPEDKWEQAGKGKWDQGRRRGRKDTTLSVTFCVISNS